MRLARIVVLVAVVLVAVAPAEQRFDLMRVRVGSAGDVRTLEAAGCIVNGPDRDKGFLVEVPADRIAALERDGWEMELLIPDIRGYYLANFEDGRYHSYVEIKDSFMIMAQDNPGICRFETLGFASNDSLLFALKITDNPDVEEDEPELFFDGAIHGDEKIAAEVVYGMAVEMISQYGIDPAVTYWVDNRETWLQAPANPDGHIRHRRSNANGVDCNRNYGYMWDDWCGTGAPFSQPETRAHMELSLRNAFCHWTSYHSGIYYISTPWSYTELGTRDSMEIHYLAGQWHDITGYPYGPGARVMYEIHGPSKDYAYGAHGGIGWTVESSRIKTPPADSIDPIVAREIQAMKMMLANMDRGVRGIVTDSLPGEPLKARVTPMPINFPCYCDSPGDYHRYLRPGTWDLVFSANGYATKTVTGLVVTADTVTRVDVQLAPDTALPVTLHRPVVCNIDDRDEIWSTPNLACGVHDGRRVSLSRSGWVVMDFGTLVYNLTGNDFTVFEDDADPEGYQVYAANNWDGPWADLGTATGTAGFDLADGGLSFCRYVKVVDDGSSTGGPTAGFDLDAIEAVMTGAAAVVLQDKVIIDSPPGGNNNGKLDPGETADLVLSLRNVGRLVAEDVIGLLRTEDTMVSVLDSTGTFGTIEPDSVRANTADRFQVSADPTCPCEHAARMKLKLTGTGYEDSLEFLLVVGELTAVDPIPDGPREPALYWAYDDADSAYAAAPVFDWVEISGTGTLLDLGDDDVEQVNLPVGFGPFIYYGQSYTQLSVCSNGFVAPGHSTYTQYTNQSLPCAAAPPVLALTWDDFDPEDAGGGGIWCYHDAANHRFIVEWDSVLYWNSTQWDKAELILYDTTLAAADGNCEFTYQYLTANQVGSRTVGEQDPTSTVCIPALFNGSYHRAGSPVVPGRAIKFTTAGPVTGLAGGPREPVAMRDAVRVLPNPSTGKVNFLVRLSRSGPVRLRVFDATGRLVRVLLDTGSDNMAAGNLALNWDGRDNLGRKTGRGVFLVRLDGPDGARNRKFVRLE